MFRGKIFFCTFCILNVVSIITQLLIWSGFKEGPVMTYMLCTLKSGPYRVRSVETLCTIGFYTFFPLIAKKWPAKHIIDVLGGPDPTGFSIQLLNWSCHIRQEFWTDKKYAPVPFKHPRLSSAMATVMLPVFGGTRRCCHGSLFSVSSPCHSVSWGGANGNATDSETEGENFEGEQARYPRIPLQSVILSACISNPGDLLRSSGCSKMWDRSFHESWMVFLKCGRYRVWCMGLGCWTMPVRCLAGEWDISDELAHTTVTGMHFKGDGWPRSKLQDHWFMSRRIGEDW